MSESGQFCERAWIIVLLVNGYFDKANETTVQQESDLPVSVLPPGDVCRRARESRDARFDGRFFIAVLTTGIYCRPTCPAKTPKEENIRYFPTAASAQDDGFRPCRRCRPESANRLPEWTISTDTVLRALRHIEAGYLNNATVASLAAELGVGERQLNRLFAAELGAAPSAIAQLCRAKLAKKLLLTSDLKHTEIAYHAGFGSVSRFNTAVREIYRQTPKEIRKQAKLSNSAFISVQLPIRGPYDFDWIFEYLRKRALVGIEEVLGGPGSWQYRRRLRDDSFVSVRQENVKGTDKLIAELPLVEEPIHSLLSRIRRVFDLNADGDAIHAHLSTDSLLGDWVKRVPGLRVPGAWDGFEMAVRAVLGQQVSVERGTDLANKMIELYGGGNFPTAAELCHQDIAEIGMPGQRGRAIAALADEVLAERLLLDDCQDYEAVQTLLQSVRGIGPWTANYIRMRVLKDPDAFPDNDWVVIKTLDCTPAQARKRAADWAPWRAYGLMYLWFASTTIRAQSVEKTGAKKSKAKKTEARKSDSKKSIAQKSSIKKSVSAGAAVRSK
ncbi:MAG: helix-turn-helix domain-containing protein [Pseudomonadales bacterium]|nr:helix-turn-helix domain-containing protein [Pseudomonadales bacterium]